MTSELLRSISELCRFSTGHGFRPRDWAKAGLPIIRIQNLNGSKKFNYYQGTPDPEWLVEPGQLLFAWAGVRGVSFGPKIWDGPRGVLNQHIYRIEPNAGIDKTWFHAALTVATNRIERKAHGFKSSLVHVKKADIANQRVFVPRTEEQVRIAESLSSSDRTIDLAERLIAAKQERRDWLMQQLLTGKRRLPRFGPPAGKREIPKDWQETPLAELFSPVRRKNDRGVTRVLTASGNHGLIDQKDYFNRSVAGERLQDYYLLRKGEFAYNRSSMDGYPCGAIKRLHDYEEGVLSTLYICFQQSSELVLPEFYEHLFESGYLDRQLGEVVQVGARAHGLLNITLQDFFSLRVPCPPLEEQQAIAATLKVTGQEIELLKDQLAALKDQKRGLMQQLLTGKRRLKVPQSSELAERPRKK